MGGGDSVFTQHVVLWYRDQCMAMSTGGGCVSNESHIGNWSLGLKGALCS